MYDYPTYRNCIEAAGVNVLAYKEFGDYQGTFIARIEGGWVHGSYGSCSGCDSIEESMVGVTPDTFDRAAFGRDMLRDILDDDEIMAIARRGDESVFRSVDQPSMVEFVENNRG